MAFYVIFPFIISAVENRIKSYKNIFQFILAGVLISQLAVGISMYCGLSMSNNSFLYFNIMNQLPCFFVGIGYYFYLNIGEKVYSWKYDLLGMLVFTIFALVLWKLKINYLFSIIPFISSVSFIFLLQIFRKKENFNNKILMRIGQISFSMYLFHFVFIEVLEHIPSSFKSYGIPSLFIFYVIIVSLTFMLGKISYNIIEKPCIKIGKRIINNRSKVSS